MAAENECTHDCSTCSASCSSREESVPTFEPQNSASHVKHVIGVVSGKGGVGKSIVTSMLAVDMQRRGSKCAILDADITGPSIPKSFGVKGQVYTENDNLIPLESSTGIKVMSLNLLLDDETKPVVWRGPVIAGAVKQFWTDVAWGEVDYMFVDMPPGTGDVPLTVFQSIPLDGIVVVTTPQDLVSMIVEKAVNMADLMGIPVIGIVENMSYVKCPDCDKEIKVFGEGAGDELCGRPVLSKVPLDPTLTALCDSGSIEKSENDYIKATTDAVAAFAKNR